MPTFVSTRERRLWFLALAVVMAIYATLGLAGTLMGDLGERRLLDHIFFWGFIAIVVTMVTNGLTRRPRVVEVGLAVAVMATYLLLVLRTGIPAAERTHLVEYGVVAVLIYEALRERADHGRLRSPPWLLAIVATSAIGILDELVQLFLPNRVFDPIDVGFNVLAAAMAVLATAVLASTRRRGWHTEG